MPPTCVVSPGAEVLLEWMRDVKAGVSYDINVRPTVITDPEVYWGKVYIQDGQPQSR